MLAAAPAQSPPVVSLTITNDAVLNWVWATQHLLHVAAEAHGSLTGDTNVWLDAGSTATVTAVPDMYYAFDRWTGAPPGLEDSNPLSLPVEAPLAFSASFREIRTANGIPHWWLGLHALPTNDAAEVADDDADGFVNLEEWVADTDPTDPASFFGPLRMNSTGPILPWTSTGRVYSLDRSANYVLPDWSSLTTFPGIGGPYVAPAAKTNETELYRARVRLPAP